MKLFLLVMAIELLSSTAWASGSTGASAILPITVRIINLAAMPLEEALAICDERALPCPAIREKQENQQKEAKPNKAY